MRKLASAVVCLAASLVLASCDKVAKVTCSSDAAVDVTASLVKDQITKMAIEGAKASDGSTIASDSAIRAAVNLLKVTLEDIRTTKSDPNSTKQFCTANAKVVVPLNVIQDADSARSSAGLNTVSEMAGVSGVERSADAFTFPLDYSVQPTDDRKSVFSESDALHPKVDFFSETLLSYLSKARILGQLQEQQRLQQEQAAQEAANEQEAKQAALEQAAAENKLSVQTINATWAAIDKSTRSQILDVQRAWIRGKDANCKIQAAGASTDSTEIETARLRCDTAANEERLSWLRQYMSE